MSCRVNRITATTLRPFLHPAAAIPNDCCQVVVGSVRNGPVRTAVSSRSAAFRRRSSEADVRNDIQLDELVGQKLLFRDMISFLGLFVTVWCFAPSDRLRWSGDAWSPVQI